MKYHKKKTSTPSAAAVASLLLLFSSYLLAGTTLVSCSGDAKSKKAQTEASEESPAQLRPTVEEEDTSTVQPRPTVADTTKVYCISPDGFLNIRETPSAKAPVIGRLDTGGEGADLLDATSHWYKVRYHDVIGYVNSSYVSTSPDGTAATSKDTRTVYYVVIGTYGSVAEAKKARYYMPDAIDSSPLFRAEAKGRTVYRMCSAIFYSRKKAMQEVKVLKDIFGFTPWIWESEGQAPCAERPIGNDGNPVRISPQ